MRIGIDSYPLAGVHAGVARYLCGVVTELLMLDPTVHYVFYSPMPVRIPVRAGNWSVAITGGGLSSKPNLWTQLVLPGLLRDDEIDVYWGQIVGLPLWLRSRCRRVLTVHDLVPIVAPATMTGRDRTKVRALMRPVASVADCLLADSEATAVLARRFLGAREDRLHVVHPGTPRNMQPVPRMKAQMTVAAEFGLREPYMLYVSTIEPRKDHLTLLRATTLMREPVRLVLAGAVGWRCRGIMEAIQEAERAGRVKYLGCVDDEVLPALYGAAQICVYPSLYEGFGLPVLEAMACGCPVVCSWSSSLPEVGGRAARYFRPRDARHLAGVLDGLLANGAELDAMSRDGLVQASRFTYVDAARKVLALFRSLAGRPGSGL